MSEYSDMTKARREAEAKAQIRLSPVNGSGTAFAILTIVAFVFTISGTVLVFSHDMSACALAWLLSTMCLWLRTFAKPKSPNTPDQRPGQKNGCGPSNRIVMEAEVLNAFDKYLARLKTRRLAK